MNQIFDKLPYLLRLQKDTFFLNIYRVWSDFLTWTKFSSSIVISCCQGCEDRHINWKYFKIFTIKLLSIKIVYVLVHQQRCSSIQLFFFWKVVRQNNTDMMSHSIQLEKVGRGLLQEAYRGERECFVCSKRGGNLIQSEITFKK